MSILALLAAWAAAWPWVRASRLTRQLAAEIALALPLGLGATGALYFALLWAGLPALAAAATGDLLFLAAGLALWKFTAARDAEDAPAPPAFRYTWAAATAFAVALLLFAFGFFNANQSNPQGNRDAWASWNLRARFLTTQPTWRDAFSTRLEYAHPENPPLLSAIVARAWTYQGASNTPTAPIAVAALCAIGLPLLAALVIGAAHSATVGWLAALLVLMTGTYWRQAPGQYNDIPQALFLVAALCTAWLAQRPSQTWSRAALALSGACASFAVLNHANGLGALLVLVAILAIAAGARAAFFALGALPVTALALACRFTLAPAPTFDASLLTASRFQTLLAGAAERALDLGGFPAHPWLAAAVLLALLGLRPWKDAAWAVLAPAGFLASGLLFVLAQPASFDFDLTSVLDRLFAQTMPALYCGLCLWAKAPQSSPEPEAQPDRPSAPPHRRKPR